MLLLHTTLGSASRSARHLWLNDFSAAEEGTYYLEEKRGDLIALILRDLNPRIQHPKYRDRLESELGFDPVAFDQLSYPTNGTTCRTTITRKNEGS